MFMLFFYTKVFGVRLDAKELEELIELDQRLNKVSESLGELSFLDGFPWLMYFPFKTVKWLKKTKADARRWFDKQLEKNYKSYKSDECVSVVDDLIKEMEKCDNQKPTITKANIEGVSKDLIGAGQKYRVTINNVHRLIRINRINKKIK